MLLVYEISGLRDRRSAERSWEATLVNEMLTQMEAFPGVMVASTNLMDGLDQAALRRFDLKIKFDFLRPEQAQRVFFEHCKLLDMESSPEAEAGVRRLNNLTLGDFALVMRQQLFNPIENPATLLSRLKAECDVKEGVKRPIGFVS
ncbi:hypothetical protein GZ77_05330 [Endozoicomonas montiporae]|uniref:ATPase AAA-type core domain-containing protein n=1 Tax=Endozoicomonas montiporae TaxID=1027273 RepID=A0A081NBU9_9GAMM|nr:AAA family ATPase [Endozoicomonas montiporae]KEQ15922.1 hypothetical protein GZ77_05330 [Endozoicomonas montiporae]